MAGGTGALGPGTSAEGAGVHGSKALLGVRAAILGRGARRDAVLARCDADLRQRAADLAVGACIGVRRAAGLRGSEALLGVRAAIFRGLACRRWRGLGARMAVGLASSPVGTYSFLFFAPVYCFVADIADLGPWLTVFLALRPVLARASLLFAFCRCIVAEVANGLLAGLLALPFVDFGVAADFTHP